MNNFQNLASENGLSLGYNGQPSMDGMAPSRDFTNLSEIANSLSDPNPKIAGAAVKALAQSANGTAAQVTSAFLFDPSPDVQLRAYETLVGIGFPALSVLNNLLAEPDPLIRKTACDALAKIGRQTLVNKMERLLTDADPQVVISAAEGLASFAHEMAVPSLISALQHPSAEVRIAVISALGTIGDERSLRALCAIPTPQNLSEVAAIIDAVGWAGKANFLVAYNFLMEKIISSNPDIQNMAFIAFYVLSSRKGAIPSDAEAQLLTTIKEISSFGPATTHLVPSADHHTHDHHHVYYLLNNMIHSSDPKIRENAQTCLIMNGYYTVDQLYAIVIQENQPDAVRLSALSYLDKHVLGLQPDNLETIGVLVKMVEKGYSQQVCVAALCFLCDKTPQVGIPLASRILKQNEKPLVDLLKVELAHCKISTLLSLLFEISDSTYLRKLMLSVLNSSEKKDELNELGENKALMISCMGDDDAQIRLETVHLLKNLPVVWARRLMLRACIDENIAVRTAAIEVVRNE